MLTRTSLVVAGLSMALAVSVPAQLRPAATEPPAEVLAKLNARTATVQELLLPARGGRPFSVAVALGGAGYTLELWPHDVRATDFRLLVDDGQAIRQVATPASTTYRGRVVGHAGAIVAASRTDAGLAAIFELGGHTWAIQPLRELMAGMPASLHVVYRKADQVLPAHLRCGNDGHHGAHAVEGGGSAGPQALKLAEIGIDADLEYFQRNGSNVTATQNAITRIMNAVDVIYQRDVEITHQIQTILVRTSRTYSNTDMGALLGEFGGRWNSSHGNIKRDLAHLFTGKGSFGGVVGIAYLGVVCNVGSAYAVSKAFHGSLTVNAGLVAHEVGHNWNSPHCNASSPCYIMCSGLGGCNGNLTRFGTFAINAITSFRNSRTCLDSAASQPPTLSKIQPATLNSYPGGTVTLTGTLLDTASAVKVGSETIVRFSTPNPTTLVFTLPSPFEIATHDVAVVNNKGPSNALKLGVLGSHPSVAVIQPWLIRTTVFPYKVHTDRSWTAVLFASPDNLPSRLPGIIDMGIGNNFATIFQIAALPADVRGLAEIGFAIPSSVTPGPIYWQAVTFDPKNIRTPFEVSNVVSSAIF